MGLVQVLSETSISSDCATLVITDTTGAYSVSNLGGYGAPNPARADLYMIWFVNLRANSGRQPVTITSYNYNTVSTLSITLSQDGWYEIYAFSTIVWASGTTYALGDIVFDVSTNLFYKSLQAGNIANLITDAAWWEATSDITDFIAATAAAQADAYDVTLNNVQLCRSIKCKAKALFQAAEEDDSCIEESDCVLQTYEKIRLRVEAAQVASALEIYDDAQEFIDDLNKLCVKCGCSC